MTTFKCRKCRHAGTNHYGYCLTPHCNCKCEPEAPKAQSSQTVSQGVGFGCCLAMVISYTANKSILWAILHGMCSWFYVIFKAIELEATK